MNCLYCGKPILDAVKPTRKYCSVVCRVGAYKRRKRDNPVKLPPFLYQFEKAFVGRFAKEENRYPVLLINGQRYRMPEEVIDYLVLLNRQDVK